MPNITFVFLRNRLANSIGGAIFLAMTGLVLATPSNHPSTKPFFLGVGIFSVMLLVRGLIAFSVTFAGQVMVLRTLPRTRKFNLARVEHVVAVPRVVVGRRRDVLGLVLDGETRVFTDISQPRGKSGIVDDVAREFERRKDLSAQ